MGTKPAPPYANIFMDKRIDKKIFKIAEKYMVNSEITIKFLKRFSDDTYIVYNPWKHSQPSYAFEELNNMHPTIKFTMAHNTCTISRPATKLRL